MKKFFIASVLILSVAAGFTFYFTGKFFNRGKNSLAEKEETEKFDEWVKRERKLLGMPGTYEIPKDARLLEEKAARAVPLRGMFARGENLNTYISAGPNNFGGRCRVVEYDQRYNGTTNRVVLAGGVNGGIFKSTDGGDTWAWKATAGYNSVTTLAQDPRSGVNPITSRPYSDTWYLGTGEFSPTSFTKGSFIPGFGMYVSDDNGDTWQPLAFSQGTAAGGPANNIHALDNVFDMVNKIVIDPFTGSLYVSVYGQVNKMSRNRANVDVNDAFNRSVVFSPSSFNGLFTSNQISDILIRKINISATKVYVSYYGTDTTTAPWDRNTLLKGVWESSTGDANSWLKIGDAVLYPAWAPETSLGRMVMALTPDQNTLYVLAENQIDNGSPTEPEADLYKLNLAIGGPGTYQFTDLSANVPSGTGGQNFRGYQAQQGFNMSIAVKPDNGNVVFIGGTNAYRSTDGFATSGNVNSIGGYQYTDQGGFTYPNTHPDIHYFAFQPGSPGTMLIASDGGISKTTDVNQFSPLYSNQNTNFQTFQFYHVAIDPVTGQNTFVGGAQDNSCSMRNSFSATPDNYFSFLETIGGDGGAVGISNINGGNQKFLYLSTQNGTLRRAQISSVNNNFTGIITNNIRPSGSSSNFVTYFYLNPDNTEDLYYTGFTGAASSPTPRLYRTTSASTVSGGGWTELSGISTTLTTPSLISSLATTRGAYNTNHNLFMGTDDGKIFRLKDPRNALAVTAPINISPVGTQSGNIIDIAVNPRNDDTVIAVVSNYKDNLGNDMPGIWFTGNANDPSPFWMQVQSNLSPFSMRSCEIVVKQTGVEFYVGTSIGLYSTTSLNGTSTVWVKEGAGTPMESAIISSLALRPSDNTLLVGTHGNGMFYASIGNIPTSVNEPIRNDKNFIQNIWPTVTRDNINIRRGTLTGIRKLDIRVFNAAGQLLFRREDGYRDLSIDVKRLAAGSYFLSVASSDYKYQTVQQFIKQ